MKALSGRPLPLVRASEEALKHGGAQGRTGAQPKDETLNSSWTLEMRLFLCAPVMSPVRPCVSSFKGGCLEAKSARGTTLKDQNSDCDE